MSLIASYYSSTDPGAPQLTGQAGSGLSLLRALLVNGYGSGGDAKPGLGWTEPFSGTNKAAFRNNAVSGTGYRLRLDDTQTRVMRLRGYTTMTTVDTGTGLTPTAAQRTNGSLWPKSLTTDSGARTWWAIGNERCFYLFVVTDPSYPGSEAAYFAGDVVSFKAGDGHHFMVSASDVNTFSGSASDAHSNLFSASGSIDYAPSATGNSGFIARVHAGTGASIPVMSLATKVVSNYYGSGGMVYPYPLNLGLLWDRALIGEAAKIVRGYMPGLILPMHPRPFSDLQVITDLPSLSAGSKWIAKNFVGLAPVYDGSYSGQVLFELDKAWQ